MPKKSTKKKTSKKKTTKKKTVKRKSPAVVKTSNMENALIQNFISLQKVMTNVAIKFDALNMQISKLLELFEISAKTLAEKDIQLNKGQPASKNDEKMVEKLDMLLDQNKIIARGLALLHEPPQQMTPMPMPSSPRPMPMMQQPQRMPQMSGGYQKSTSIQSVPVKKSPPKKLRNPNENGESAF